MGRKLKNKEKQQQRKEEHSRLLQSKSIVDKANKLDDPLSDFPIFKRFKKENLNLELKAVRVKNLIDNKEDEIVNWAFNLTKRNMQERYNSCNWKWEDDKKFDEMTSYDSWFLLAYQTKQDSEDKSMEPKKEYIAFSHFKFDIDYGDEVLYCYELQVEEGYRRRGIGKFMMQVLELMSFKNQMKKVILTVLKNSPESIQFYKKLNYGIDETSPVGDEETYPYEILSKYNKKLLVSSN